MVTWLAIFQQEYIRIPNLYIFSLWLSNKGEDKSRKDSLSSCDYLWLSISIPFPDSYANILSLPQCQCLNSNHLGGGFIRSLEQRLKKMVSCLLKNSQVNLLHFYLLRTYKAQLVTGYWSPTDNEDLQMMVANSSVSRNWESKQTFRDLESLLLLTNLMRFSVTQEIQFRLCFMRVFPER